MTKRAPTRTKLWWLGPVVVFTVMLSVMLLVGTLTSALGMGPAEGRVQILIDNVIELEVGGIGGWDWTPIRLENLNYRGRHLLTIRWITVDPTVGALCIDSLSFNGAVIEGFERDPAASDWIYSENDPENAVTLGLGSPGVWCFRASKLTAPYTNAQISREYDFTGVENLTLTTRGSWDAREIADVISHLSTYSVALGVVYLHVTRFERRKRFWSSVGVRKENALASIVWIFALSVVFTTVLFLYWQAAQLLTGADPQQEVRSFFSGSDSWYFAYLGFAFFFPVAFTEEIVFRGFMIERFLSAKGAPAAIGLSSLLFSSLHLWYLSFGSRALLFYGGLFLLALWWGLAYYKTRNVVGPIVFHGLYNFGMVVEHFWSASGRALLESGIFLLGVGCLGYLIYVYLRGLFTEIEELVKPRGRAPLTTSTAPYCPARCSAK
jgi:membrane protease YdiL (CAAX protease family)